jgi:DNA-binding CsgD family transcriptional regulator
MVVRPYFINLITAHIKYFHDMNRAFMKHNHTVIPYNFNILQSMLLELMQEGIMLISYNLPPIYLNIKAREICHRLWNGNHQSDALPPVISAIYRQLNRNLSSQDKVFLMDHQIAGEQTIRIRACYLPVEVDNEPNVTSGNRSLLLVLLEDRDAILQEELRIEQKKYNLTERELEVFGLLSQSYSYQEIANKLLVSPNTVKFHVKNINFKRNSCFNQDILQIN